MIIYVRGENPIWFFNNLTGQTLDDTYYAFFLTNDLPYVPQAVYQDPNGISPWSNPIEFQPSGGLPNNLYFNPTQVYRIEIRQGPNQTSPLIWLIQNYVSGDGGSGGSTVLDPLTVAANIITDPNFSDVYFNGSYTYIQGAPGTYTLNVAPGWQLVLTGAGTTILTQGTFQGMSNTPGNPSYYLDINNTGWSSAILTQTLSNNGAIFANGAIAVAFTAQAMTTGQNITVNYVPNGTANSSTIVSAPVTTGGFVQYYGAISLPVSKNTNTDGLANVQIQFVLPAIGEIQLTNIQVVGQSTPLSVNFNPPASATTPNSVPSYQELTYGQIVNAEFNIYQNSIMQQPKDSILVGWNFGLNPWQFTTTTVTNVATNQYTADQTIIIQQNYVSSATGNNVAIGQAPLANDYALEVKAVTAHNQFAILQYLAPQSVRPYWGRTLSALVRASLATSHSSIVQFKARLIYKAALPGIVAQADPITSWVENTTNPQTTGSDPVAAAGYTLIVPPNDPIYTLTGTATNFSFNGFTLPASTNANMTLGLLIYTISNMNQTATADIVFINDVSLVNNDFAISTNAKTFDQTLRECQYYYEKSYPVGTLPGTATSYIGQKSQSALVVTAAGSASTMYLQSYYFDLNQTKRIPPTSNTLNFYSPVTGTIGTVCASVYHSGTIGSNAGVPLDVAIAGQWNLNTTTYTSPYSPDRILMISSNTATTVPYTNVAAALGDEGILNYHYTVDVRLGI